MRWGMRDVCVVSMLLVCHLCQWASVCVTDIPISLHHVLTHATIHSFPTDMTSSFSPLDSFFSLSSSCLPSTCTPPATDTGLPALQQEGCRAPAGNTVCVCSCCCCLQMLLGVGMAARTTAMCVGDGETRSGHCGATPWRCTGGEGHCQGQEWAAAREPASNTFSAIKRIMPCQRA